MDAKKKNNGQKSDTNSSDPYLFSVAAFDKPLSLRTLAISERHTRHSTDQHGGEERGRGC